MRLVSFGNFGKVVKISALDNEETFVGEYSGLAAFLDDRGVLKKLGIFKGVH